MKRLLVIRLGALGDLVHLSAALNAVHQTYPEMEIHLLTRPGFLQLAEMIPSVHKTWAWSPQTLWKGGWETLWQMAKTLRGTRFDGIVNLHPSFKTWLLTRLINQPTSVYKKQKLKEKGLAQRKMARRHAVEDFYQPFTTLAGLSGLVDKAPFPSFIPQLDVASPDGEPETPSVKKSQSAISIGLIPGVGGKRGNRAWPMEQWVALLGKLPHSLGQGRPLHLHLFGGQDEQALADALIAQMPPSSAKLHNHCGRWDIRGTATLMQQCDAVIGGDTGPLHLAAGLGIPVIGLFGPTSVDRTGPRGSGPTIAIVPPENLACWPCELPQCPLGGEAHLACVRDITPEQVLDRLTALLAP